MKATRIITTTTSAKTTVAGVFGCCMFGGSMLGVQSITQTVVERFGSTLLGDISLLESCVGESGAGGSKSKSLVWFWKKINLTTSARCCVVREVFVRLHVMIPIEMGRLYLASFRYSRGGGIPALPPARLHDYTPPPPFHVFIFVHFFRCCVCCVFVASCLQERNDHF